jgi:hypothetical protein
MKQNDWNEAIDNISDDIIERYVLNVDNFSLINKKKRTVRRVCLFSCLGILILSSILTFVILNDLNNNLSPDNSQEIILSEKNTDMVSFKPVIIGSACPERNTPAPTVIETPQASKPPIITTTPFTEQPSDSGILETNAPTEEPREPIVVNDSLVLVQSNNLLSKSYENFLWSKKWIEAGWISGDGMSVSHKFSVIENEIPQITYCDDFEIFYKEGIEFLSFSIYNSNFSRIYHNVKDDVLSDLEEGTYFLIINVKSQGEYIETEEKYEYSGYECVYKIHIAG